MNVHGVIEVRQTEIDTAEPLVPELNYFKFEMVYEKLKKTNHQVLIKCQQNSMQQGVEEFAETHKLIDCAWDKEDLPEEWKELIIVPIYKNGSKKNCSNYTHITFVNCSQSFMFHRC